MVFPVCKRALHKIATLTNISEQNKIINMSYHIEANLGKLLSTITAPVSAELKKLTKLDMQSNSMRISRFPWVIQNDE